MVRLLSFALLLGAGLAVAEHPLSDPKVYLTKEGIRAVVAQVKGADDKGVLLVSAPQSELDGLVLDCRVERLQYWVNYFVVRRGREFLAFQEDGPRKGSLGSTARGLEYSEPETKKVDLEALWARHGQQSGQLATFSRFDRAAEAAVGAKELATRVAPVNRACGTQLKFISDWSAASDEVFKSTDGHSDCIAAAEFMGHLCEQYRVVRLTFAQKLTEVRCTYAEGKQTFNLAGTTLTMTSNKRNSLPEGLWDFLKEAL